MEQFWDIIYIVKGKKVETIERNKPLALARFIRKNKEATTHRMGNIVLIKSK